jgi:uncharacterized protein
MARRASFQLGGHRVTAGRSADLYLPVSEAYTGDTINMPVRVMHAARPGPVVFVTAAIHGDEINGTGIIHDFLFGEPIALTRGTLLLVPVVNVFGFESNERYLPDRRDLNRSFPGTRGGSLASRLAYTLMHEIVEKATHGIDLHSAATHRTNFPNVRADLSRPEVRSLAVAFGCALVVDGKGPIGSFRREATRLGRPTIILEAGEPLKIEPTVMQIGVQGIRNVLIHLDMLEGSRVPPPFQAIIRKTVWLRATVGGILKFHVSPGDFVVVGQPVATNYSIFGKEQHVLVSPSDGIVLGMTTLPAVKPGEPVCHIAMTSSHALEGYRRRLRTAPGEVHQRARRHLATNVDVVAPGEGNGSSPGPADRG